MYEEISLDGHEAVWLNKPFNITLITGDPGSGKSVLSKIILSEVWYNPKSKAKRRCVVYDLKGDYVRDNGLFEYGVRNSNRPVAFNSFNCNVIRYWRPHLLDVQRADFLSLGMTSKGSIKCFDLLKRFKKEHKWDIKLFLDFLKAFPTGKKDVNYKRYGEYVREDVKQGILDTLTPFKSIFSKKRNYDLCKEVFSNNVIFIPPENLRVNKPVMRFYYGIITRLIERAIYDLNALLVVEECDWLFPNPFLLEGEERDNPLPIMVWFDSLFNKEGRKNNVSLVLISQRRDLMNPAIGRDEPVHYWIAGFTSNHKELSQLVYNYETNDREFFFKDFMTGYVKRFRPKFPGVEV